MTTLEQAARQALAALEASTDWDVGAKGRQLQSMKAITALRSALEQPQQDQDAELRRLHAENEELRRTIRLIIDNVRRKDEAND